MSWLAWPWYFSCKVNSTNGVLPLKNTLYTGLRDWEFHTMPFFNCNILEGASITELFYLGLLSSKSDSWRRCPCTNVLFSLVACEDCLEVCFVGLVVERICVWCLVIVAIFMGFGQARAKRCGGCLKVINWGWWCKSQKGGSFHRESRFSLQVLLGIYCKRFYWIPLPLCFTRFEVGKTKSATQSVPVILTLNGLF